MSGGTFDYKQYQLLEISDDIEATLAEGRKSDIISQEMHNIMIELRDLHNRIHNLDYYLAGDYGEDTYIKKLKGEKNASKTNI